MREKVFYPGSQFKDIGKIDTEPGFFTITGIPAVFKNYIPELQQIRKRKKKI
jgi:hypothetical protein